MNLLKKGIFAMLIAGSIVSCEEDDTVIRPTESQTGSGLTEIVFSSFTAKSGSDSNGLNDGTYVTVTPLTIGASSIEVDFGNGGAPLTIAKQGGSVSYDYPNLLEEVTYTITVTAKSNTGLASVSQTENLTVEHDVTNVSSAPSSPTQAPADVLSFFSDGIVHNGGFIGYSAASGADLDEGAAQYEVTTLDSGNKVIQYSRLSSTVNATIELNEIEVADAFDGAAATHINFDVHSDFAVGIDKLKITLMNGSTEYTYNQDLVDGEWVNLNLDLATDFSAPVVKFDEIKFELGAGGTANDAATLNVDNVYLHKPISSKVLNGDFSDKQNHWKIDAFTDGKRDPFNSTSDGSYFDYDGVDLGSKTGGAKWTSSTSAGTYISSSTRYAYQALKLEPNTNYTLEYQYAIKSDNAVEPEGGRRIVAEILDGHFIDGVDAVNSSNNGPLARHSGTIAEGKFNSTRGTTVLLPFTTNDSGEISIWIYAVTPKDAYVDNVKIY